MIYLDYQATTPLAPEAREAMLPWLAGPDSPGFANPHSPHRPGRQAAAAVEIAREQVAALLPAGGRVIFTSGATEALNLAILGSGRRRLAVSAIEHAAVLETARFADPQAAILPVDAAGLVDPAIVLPDGVDLAPQVHGGGQEGDLRSGTLSPALCAGFGAAAQLAVQRRDDDAANVEALWEAARNALPGFTLNGSSDQRWRGNLNIRREGLDIARLMSDLRDIAFSAGSACASGSGKPSYVLRAIGLSDKEARSSIRLGFGRYSRAHEVTEACARIAAAAEAQ